MTIQGILRYFLRFRDTAEKCLPNLWSLMEFEIVIKDIIHINNCTLLPAGTILDLTG